MLTGDEKKLLEYAKRILEVSGLELTDFILGGGTVLKYEYDHRMSKDLDFFIDDPQRLAMLSPKVNDAVEGEYTFANDMGNYIKYVFPEGKVDFICSGRVTDFPPRERQINGIRLLLDDPVEIVAKKLCHRADHFHARDFFDLAVLYRSDRGEDLVNVGASMPDKIEVLAKRIEDGELRKVMNSTEKKTYRILRGGLSTEGHEAAIASEFIAKVRECLRERSNSLDK